MRCSGWSSLAISVCKGGTCPALVGAVALALTLILAAPVAAHVVAYPAFVPSKSTRSVDLAGPNEREDPMTGFKVTAPAGLVIEHAHEVEGWTARFDGRSAEWSEGSLAPNVEETFGITLKAVSEPDVLDLTAAQLYADGAVVSWPVAITVTPAEETPSENLALAAVVGLIGFILVVAIAMLAWRRREPTSPTP